MTFKEGITRNTRNCRNYHKDFTIIEEDKHQSVAFVGSCTTSKCKIIKKKGKFAYTKFKSFRGSRALEKLNATWHFEKSEDIHFLVLASSIVNYKKENIYFLICMLKVKKKNKTHTHTHTFHLKSFLGKMVRTRGTSPQLYACMGGRGKRRQPNLWSYGWSLLVIGLEIKQAQAFNN